MGSLKSLWSWVSRIRILPPHDKEFFTLFDELIATVLQSAQLLKTVFTTEESEVYVAQLQLKEQECNFLVRKILDVLDDAQQPPFNPDYIHELTLRIDDIMDQIEYAANRYQSFGMPVNDVTMIKLTDIIISSSRHLGEAIKKLPKRRGLEQQCQYITELEAQADIIHREAIAARYTKAIADQAAIDTVLQGLSEQTFRQAGPTDVPTLTAQLFQIARANREFSYHIIRFSTLLIIYGALEQATDACAKVAVILRRMVTNNG